MKMPFLLFFFLICNSSANARSFRQAYYKPFFGNIHKKRHIDSAILVTISCGHPISVFVNKKNKTWWKVKSGPYTGFIKKTDLSFKKIICFQDKYPKFFSRFKFSVEDLYLWGKLNDRYVKGRVRLK